MNAIQYAQDIVKNKNAGKLVILSCERFLSDLQRDDLDFRIEKVEKVLKFFQLLQLTNRKQFILEPWQQFIIANLFGFYITQTNERRFNYSHVEVARKNGKSTFSAGIALFLLLADNEQAAEIFVAATKREQAKIVWREAVRMLKTSPALRNYVQITQFEIRAPKSFGVFKALASEAKSLDGLNISCAIVDELHEHPNRKLYNVLKSGTGSRLNPLMSTITTAGFNIESFAYEHRQMCINILEKKIIDDAQFVMIFTLDKDDDWEDSSCWIKANPNLNISTKLSYLKQEYIQAKNNPSERVNFLTKHLNIWTQSSQTWIPNDVWTSVTTPIHCIEGSDCYIGLDLGATADITAMAMLFPGQDDEVHIKVEMWIPNDSIPANDNYRRWVDEGWLKTTPGNVTDYNYIKQRIFDIGKIYSVQSIAYDPWNATQLIIDLESEIPDICVPFRQGFQSLSGPTKEFERLAMQQKIIHEHNPVFAWMLSNVVLKIDPAGNIKPSKENQKNKIDVVIASIMANGVYMKEKAKNDDDFVFAIV